MHLEFLNRNQGTFPEIITEAHLETLNFALRFLFARLREARRQFHDQNEDGRSAAFIALGAIWQFVVLFRAPTEETLQVPILHLQDALVALDNNHVLPIVTPLRRRGRARSSPAFASLKGHAAGTVKRLIETGLSRPDAQDAVAKQLRNLGIRSERGSGQITATTVRNWCNEVYTDVGRHGPAALMYYSMFTPQNQERLDAMSRDAARRFARASLAAYAQSMFPVRKKPS